MTGAVFDWNGMVRDLAQHLISAPSKEQVSYILDDADRDVTRLGCPPDFWSRVLGEYEALLTGHPWPGTSRSLAEKLAPTVRAVIRRKVGPEGHRKG